MIKSLLNLARHSNPAFKDTEYSYRGTGSAITLGARSIGGSRGMGYTSGGTFDYLSNAENTIECYYQKLDDLRYYESHALTEKIVGIFRDYISQLWKEGSQILDIPGEDPKLVEELNKELESIGLLEILMKDLTSVIFYGSVTYEISREDELDPKNKFAKDQLREQDLENKKIREKKYSDVQDLTKGEHLKSEVSFYRDVVDTEYGETLSQRAKRLVDSTSPEVSKLVESTSPSALRGVDEAGELRKQDTKRLNPIRGVEAKDSDAQKVGDIRSKLPHKARFRLNKLKHPHHTVVEYDRKVGRRYLVMANERYHIPTNKHQLFFYGNDSMRIMEKRKRRGVDRSSARNVASLVGYTEMKASERKEFKALGIDPKDPKKTPTRYELLNRELSAGSPLFYHYLPKVRELYLKDLVVSILGIKDVIQPDILAMNFEGGTNLDHAQELCNDMEDMLNKNSDYSIFNSAALNYNDLTKLLADTVRVLPDVDGKLQSVNPIRTTTLQEKIQQIRMESKELERDILSSLGVPVDLFEGNSSKWEVIKRSERLQSRVSYYINTLKGSIRRLAQSIFYLLNDRELKSSDFKVTVFNESELDIATKTNKLQNLTELSQTLLNVVIGAERELGESRLINKEAYFKLLKANLKEIYPEVDDLIDIEGYMNSPTPESPY